MQIQMIPNKLAKIIISLFSYSTYYIYTTNVIKNIISKIIIT